MKKNLGIDSVFEIKKPNDDDLRKVASWIRFHKKEYKIIVDKCLDSVNEGNKNVDFEILVARLVTIHKVSIKYDLIFPLKKYIESEYPELNNRLMFGKKPELNLNKCQLMMLVSQLLT